MATFETRKYSDKKTGKVRERIRVKIRLTGFPPEEDTFDSMTMAKAWASKREHELRYQRSFGTDAFKSKTVGELLDRYENALRSSNPKRHKDAKPVLRMWANRLGPVKIGQLSKDRIVCERDRLKALRVKGDPNRPMLSNAAVNRQMTILKTAFNVAVKEWDWLTSNPLDGIKQLPEPKGRTRFLQPDELLRLLDAARASENSSLLTLIVVAITTGARRGELQKIRLTEVNLQDRQIILPTTKNGKPRLLRLEGYAHSLVQKLLEQAHVGQIYLFASTHDPKRPNDFRTAWRTAVARSNLEDFKFHDLRHTAASYYAMNGAGLHQIAEILGHTSLQVTKRYTHMLESHTAKVVERTAIQVFGDDTSRLAE